MKIQDLLFFIIFIGSILLQRRKLVLVVGLLCYVGAMFLYSRWIFFTAERFVWYGSLFIFSSFVISKLPKGKLK